MKDYHGMIRKLLKSASLWSMIGTGLRVGGGLVTLPLALRTIPSQEMGLYYTFISINSIAMLLDFGFAPAIARNAAYAMGGAKHFVAKGLPNSSAGATPNWELLEQLKYAVQRWYWILGTILAALILTLGTAFISKQIQDAGLPSQLIYCWFAFAGSAVYGFITLYWHDLLMGIGSVTKVAKNNVIGQTTGILITITGLYSGWGLWAYAIGTFIGSGISRTLCKKAFFTDTILSGQTLNLQTIRSVFVQLWPMAWRQGVVMIGAFLIQRGNTLICSAKLGLNETASYGLSLTVLTLLFQVTIIPLTMAWPRISQLRIQRQTAQIRHIFFTRLYIGLAIALAGILFGAWLGPYVLKLIGSKTPLLPSPVFIFMGIIFWLEYHHSAYAGMVLSGNTNPFLIPAVLSGFAIFILSWPAAGLWGVAGLLLVQGSVQLAWNNWWTVKKGLQDLRQN